MVGPSRRPRAQSLGHPRRQLASCIWREGCRRHLVACIIRDQCLDDYLYGADVADGGEA